MDGETLAVGAVFSENDQETRVSVGTTLVECLPRMDLRVLVVDFRVTTYVHHYGIPSFYCGLKNPDLTIPSKFD